MVSTLEKPGEVGPLSQIKELIAKGNQVAYVGDVVGRHVQAVKSATNSVLWFFGDELPHIPNKKMVVCVYRLLQFAVSIFFNTMEDAGALPVESRRC
ncbi:hypothetical protein ACLFLN_13565 [Acinetobacter pittii]